MIAHRLSTVQYADTIFLLGNGGVTGSGTYNELIKSNETFKEMDDITWRKESDDPLIVNV